MSCTTDFKSIKNSFVFYKRVTEQYREQTILKSIKELIPEKIIANNPRNDMDKLLLVSSLLCWFKNDFMNWMPKEIKCDNCSNKIRNNTCFVDNADNDKRNPSLFMQSNVLMNNDNSWKLRKVEVHSCASCDDMHIFPRYGEVLRISETRTGRCSEWSILFGAILNSVSLPARIVHDYLDHCWNEVFLDGRWIHLDSTLQYPISLNHPHYYEQNWKKQYLYVLAFDATKVEDVTKKYTERWDSILTRRSRVVTDDVHRHKQEQEIASSTPIVDFQNFYSKI